jgi:hypothetical protein
VSSCDYKDAPFHIGRAVSRAAVRDCRTR